MKTKLKKVLKNFLDILKLPEMQVLPGQLAFNIIMSFVPILAICAIIISRFSFDLDFINMIRSVLPAALADIVIPLLNSNTGDMSVFLLFLLYLITAIHGAKSVIITSNRLYKEKIQNGIAISFKALTMTIVLILLLIFILIIPILGDTIMGFIYKFIGSPTYLLDYLWLYEILKILVSFFFIYFAIKLLYTLAPNKEIKSKTTTRGAMFTTISWIIATEIFAFYITRIAKYNVLYGNFANILILLIWVYILAYLFVMGIALNINYYNSLQTKEVK